jgi:pilus assembly protein CpaE
VNCDEEAAPELRTHLLSVAGVKIVAEVDEPTLLGQALNQFPAEVVLLHLDPNPQGMMDAVGPVLEQRKDRIAAIGMTEDRDAELVMRAMRVGMKEFLWKPFPPEQLNEILQRVAAQAAAGAVQVGQVIPVVGASGGVGATWLAANLAVELAQLDGPRAGEKARVALADLDLRFGQAAMFLDAQPSYTIADLCDSAELIEPEMVQRVMCRHASGVHVLAHPQDPTRAERISAAHCAAVVGALQTCYDYVVLDGPVRIDPTARAIFDLTDCYLLVLQLLVPCVRNTDRILHELARGGFNLERVKLVCNRFGRDAGFIEAADAEATLNRKLDFMLPDDWKTASTAVNMGAPLLDYAPKSKLRLAVQRIATALANVDEAAGEVVAAGAGDGGSKGLLGFLAGKRA